MSSRPKAHARVSPPPDHEPADLRIVEPPPEEHVEQPDRQGEINWWNHICQVAISVVRDCRDLGDVYDMTQMRRAARKTCVRLLESDDPKELLCGIRFFLALYAQENKSRARELDLVTAVIKAMTPTPKGPVPRDST